MTYVAAKSSLEPARNALEGPSRWLMSAAILIIGRSLWAFIADPSVLAGSLK